LAGLLALGQTDTAARLLAGVDNGNRNSARYLRLHARVLIAAGRRREGIGALMLALDGLTGAADEVLLTAAIMGELGEALLHDGAAEQALPFCQEAFRLHKTVSHAATLSCLLIEIGRDADALRVTEAVPGLDPAVWLNRSIALDGVGRPVEAVEAARRLIRIVPENALAQLNLATTLLGQGHLTAEAWRLYESRLRLGVRRLPEAVRWNGRHLDGGTILLHAEQGLGDTLQFVRYVPLVAARTGAQVVLAVQPSLVRLLQRTPGAATVIAAGSALPRFDVFVSLLSLPMLFETTLESIPPLVPYARIDPADRYDVGHNGAVRVGVVWAGSAGFVADRARSLPERLVLTLGGVERVTLHSLQFGTTAGSAERLGLIDRMGGVGDFLDTAGRIAGLDLVIAVDTSVAHLAATMGKPVWLLSRFHGCWRWLRGREDSPWYPTMRIFRQERSGDWESVIGRVRDELVEFAAGRPRIAA
jgi:hypothetical protein